MAKLFFAGVLLLVSIIFPDPVGAANLRDPLRPTNFVPITAKTAMDEKTQEPQWRFTAVLHSAQRVVAVINGKALQVGDRIAGYRVKSIAPERVRLQKAKQIVTVPRVGSGLKKLSHARGQ